MYANLHIHSTYSDGTDTPNGIFELAKKHSINTIAITDHDCVNGVKAAHKIMDSYDVRLIDGVEISTIYDGNFVHILGYYINVNSPALSKYITESAIDKTENTLANFNNAINQGAFSYSWERVLELNKAKDSITGLDVKEAMEADGYIVPSMTHWEMFRKYFMVFSDEFIATEKHTPYDAIDVIAASGGISVLAHPNLIGSESNMMKFIDYGTQGLEAFHPTNSIDDSRKYIQLAKDKNLYITGGTDWHGGNNSSIIKSFDMCGLENENFDILSVTK